MVHPRSPAPRSYSPGPQSQAFTLVEMLIALAVFSLLAEGINVFFTTTQRGLFSAKEQGSMTQMVSNFEQTLRKNMAQADVFAIFDDFFDTNLRGSAGTSKYVTPGRSGKCLVLGFYNTSTSARLTKLIVYYRDRSNQLRFYQRTSIPSPLGTLQTNLPSSTAISTHKILFKLAATPNALFTNLYDKGVLFSGKVTYSRYSILAKTGQNRVHDQTFDVRFGATTQKDL